jgi:hypothetical protein
MFWAFMSFIWKMRLLMLFVWNDVDSCFKLNFHVCYASIYSKLSSLYFWMLNFEFLKVFTSKPKSRACLIMSARCGEGLLVVARLPRHDFVIWLIKWDVCLYHVWTMIYDYVVIYVTVIWAINCEMINYDDYVCWIAIMIYDVIYVDE